MPLSEDEQRILQDIERSFYETDPKFAESVSRTTLYRHAGRNCKWAVALFVVSLVVLVACFVNYPLIAFVGFLGMVAATTVFVKKMKRNGNAGLKEMSDSMATQQMSAKVEGYRRNFRDKFRRNTDQ